MRRFTSLASLTMTAVIGVLLFSMAMEARDFLRFSKYFPLVFGIAGAGLTVLILVFEVANWRKLSSTGPESWTNAKAALRISGWLLLYMALIALVGFPFATVAFTAGFLRLEAGAGWILAMCYGGMAMAFIFGMGRLLNLAWPSGLLPTLF